MNTMCSLIPALLLLVSSPLAVAEQNDAVLKPSTTVDNLARQAAMRSWKVSLAPLVASQALDAASSYGMRELNPLLASGNGGFGAKAVSLKAAITGTAVLVECVIVKKHPGAARGLAKLNWSTGIVTTGFAAHNYAIK